MAFEEIATRLASDLQTDLGLSREQALGLVGNLAMESIGFSTLQEIKPLVPGSRGGFGYAQWTGPRRVAFETFAKNNSLDPTSYEANYGFLKKELTGTYRPFLSALKKTDTVAEATRLTQNRFLAPDPAHANSDQRTAWVNKVASVYSGPTSTNALDAIKAATAMDPTSVLSSYTAGPKLTASPAQVASIPSYVTTPPAVPAATSAPVSVQYPGSVTLNVPVQKLLGDVRAAEPGMIAAATFLAPNKDEALTKLITDKLPSYMQFDPTTNSITFNDLVNPDVQKALAGGVNSGFPKIDSVFTPYLQAAQNGMTTPIPLPRDARPTSTPAAQPTYQPNMLGRVPSSNFGTSYNPTSTLSVLQGSGTSVTPAGTPWQTPLPAAARTLLAKPYSVSTATLAPNQAMTPTGAVIGSDALRALSDPNYSPAATVSQRADTPPPAAARPVAPPPVYTWTTSSWLPSPPPTPATRPTTGATAQPENKGLFGGINPFGMLSGFIGNIAKGPSIAPRGQFGQPLGIGGTYRDGAIWAADGSGYGGSAGQSTAGLKTGERVYDTNTGEWGLKVGQPVTWTGGTSGNTSTATGTFQGSSTGRTYIVGKQYTAGGYVYTAMPNGTFKKV